MTAAFTTRELKKWDVYYFEYRDEFGGGKIGRPGVIVSPDRRNQSAGYEVSVVFLTTSPQSGTWYPVINSTGRKSYAVCGDITRVRRDMIGTYCATLTSSEIEGIKRGLADYLDLNGGEDELERTRTLNEDLQKKIAELESKLASVSAEVEKKELDAKVYELAYGKVLDRLVEKQIDLDYLKKLAQTPAPAPVVVEKPVEEAPKPENPEPVTEETPALVDINRCTERELMDLGFTLSVARNITAARPFMKKDDLLLAQGVTKVAYGLVKRKITVGDISEYQKPKKPVKLDPLETVEPVEDKVNVNTASAAELSEKLGIDIIACYSITGPRKRDGLYKSTEEVKNCKKLGPKQWEKIKDRICV